MTPPAGLQDIQQAYDAGDLDRASALAVTAMEAGVMHPLVLRLAARRLQREGRWDEAVAVLRRGLSLAPSDAELLVALGGCLMELDRRGEALQVFLKALAADPDNAEAHYGAGECQASVAAVDAARTHFETALRLAPDHVESGAALANLLARTGRPQEGRRQAERTLRLSPGHPTAQAALAAAEVGEGDYAAAEARLRFMLGPVPVGAGLRPLLHAACQALLGDALHAQGRAADAFAAYAAANDELAEIHGAVAGPQADQLFSVIVRLIDWFEQASPQPRVAAPSLAPDASGATGHVFLLGFHRSGTTLIEQVLAAHRGVVTLEEGDLLAEAARAFLGRPGGLDALAAADANTLARYREGYWRAARAAGAEPQGKLFLDKMPLDTINLPLIVRLFPDAKILFARRDPRDVVLSCFRHVFSPNGATYAMLTLEGAAGLYDAVMRLAELYRAKLPIDVHEVRHERFVADFEGETRAICGFLGLPWDDAVYGFPTLSQARTIATPSAGQVRRGLYREGEAPWRAYRRQLAPVLPMLDPWAVKFGYPPD
jgi:tetratricopeptide (TPR) repeat protein